MELKGNNLVCIGLFEVGLEVFEELNRIFIYGYIDYDFLDNFINNYLVLLFLYFGV